MRSSAIVLAGLSALALAAPLQKRAYVTDTVIDYVTVYVTEGNLPTISSSKVVPTTTSTPPVVTSTTPEPVAPASTQGVFIETKVVDVTTSIPTPTPEPVVETPTPTPTPEAPVTTQAPVQETTPTPVETTAAAPVVATTSSAAAVASPASDDYKSVVLYHHNVHRTNHSAPALTYDDTLAGYAATLAKTCVFAHDTSIGGGGYGQNLAQSGSTAADESSLDPASIVPGAISNQWYNGELPLFDPSLYGQDDPDMTNFSEWGHFSQVVWKGTTAVGCATQFCGSNTDMFTAPFSGWYTVCNYGSPGNVAGAYGSNVLKPLGQASVVPS